MSIIIPSNSIVSGGYDVANSCRFNDGSSDNLTKTLGTSTNAYKGTVSHWVKRSTLGAMGTFAAWLNGGSATARAYLNFNNDDIFFFDQDNSMTLETNRKFRDVSAWYHIVCAWDTSQGTESNRVKIYVNGVQETSFSTANYPSVNSTLQFNTSGRTFGVGNFANSGNADGFFDGYQSEFVFIDGQQLAPTDFGEFDEDSGIWKPINVSGLTFGTNGFYLDFEDSANLGNDANGGTDLTENNLTAIDQSTDTCTNNFATLNVLNKGTSVSLSEGNLAYTAPSGSFASVLSTIGFSQGKWYAEYQWKSGSNSHVGIGKENINYNHYLSYTANGYSYYKDGRKFNNSSASSYGNSYAVDDIIGVALDLDNGAIWFSKNGTWQNSATLTEIQNGTTTNAAFTSLSGEFFFGTGMGNSNELAYFNFGSPPYSESGGETDGNGYGNFAHAVPSGYYSLNTKNLAEYG